MSWDDDRTDMAHCTWCSWDLYKKDAIDMMHADCVIKANRRASLRDMLCPMLIELGLRPDAQNLLTDMCLRIEKALDEEQST
jgi:hypothetical protein